MNEAKPSKRHVVIGTFMVLAALSYVAAFLTNSPFSSITGAFGGLFLTCMWLSATGGKPVSNRWRWTGSIATLSLSLTWVLPSSVFRHVVTAASVVSIVALILFTNWTDLLP